MNDYYGTRRRRNINLSWEQEGPVESVYTNPGWNKEPELEEEYEVIEEYEENNGIIDDEEEYKMIEKDGHYIDGKQFVPKELPTQQKKKESFMDTHSRYTTYLEKNLLHIIRMLQESGQIESITKFINDSIKERLMSKYHNEN